MKFWRTLHKWVGLIVALQILFWISGGVVMTVIPLDMVRGQHLVIHPPKVPERHALPASLPVEMAQYSEVQWVQRLGKVALKTTALDGQVRYLSASGLEELPPLTPEQASDLAQSAYQGQGNIAQVNLIDNIPHEARRLSAPVFRIDFDDWIHTSFYLLPDSGDIATVRSDLWRLFDFFWMLHIMDYDEREDFNNPLLITAAVTSLLFTFSGLCLLYFSLFKPKVKKWHHKLRQSGSGA